MRSAHAALAQQHDTPSEPVVKATLNNLQPVLMVHNVKASIAFYARLGFEHLFSDSTTNTKYAGVRRDSVELHLQWHAAADWNHSGDRPTYRIVVSDVDQLYAELGEIPDLDKTEVWNTDWGTREFHVRDIDGNGLQFYRPL